MERPTRSLSVICNNPGMGVPALALPQPQVPSSTPNAERMLVDAT